LITKETWQCQ